MIHLSVWNQTLTRAGLQLRTPYNTRPTFASQLLGRGADIAWVARLMGHANTKMVITRYWKWIRNRSQQDDRENIANIGQHVEGIVGGNRPYEIR